MNFPSPGVDTNNSSDAQELLKEKREQQAAATRDAADNGKDAGVSTSDPAAQEGAEQRDKGVANDSPAFKAPGAKAGQEREDGNIFAKPKAEAKADANLFGKAIEPGSKYETPEAEKTPEVQPMSDPEAKGKVEAQRSEGIKLGDVDGFKNVNVIGQGDASNRDSSEAKNALLDGQLDSYGVNNFTSFEDDKGNKYLGFSSGGYDGKLDGNGDRYGVIKLDENGKVPGDMNLGADEWGEASDKQKALLKKAHESKDNYVKEKFAGSHGDYQESEKLKRTIDTLQNVAEKNPGLKMGDLNELMTQLNNGGADLATITNKLAEIKDSEIDGKSVADLAANDRIAELKDSDFSQEEIKALTQNVAKADNYDAKQKLIDDAIDTKRNAKHKLTDEQKQEFQTKINDLLKRVKGPEKAILQKLASQAGLIQDKDGNYVLSDKGQKSGLDNMGKYLFGELNGIAENNPKPVPKNGDDGKPIDFEKNGIAKQFRDGIGKEKVKEIFGDDYASNPAFKDALKDYEALNDAKGKDDKQSDSSKQLQNEFLSLLKKSSKDDKPEAMLKKFNADLKGRVDKMSKAEELLANKEAELEKKGDQVTDSEKQKLADQKKALEAGKKSIKLQQQFSSLAGKYSVNDQGKLEKDGNELFLKAQEKEKINNESKTGYKQEKDFDKALAEVESSSPDNLKFGALNCGPCLEERGMNRQGQVVNQEQAKQFKKKMDSLNGQVLDYFPSSYRDNSKSPNALITALRDKGFTFKNKEGQVIKGNIGVPALFEKVGDKEYKLT